jgi:predicted site-specific integrase-resolvase
MSARVAEGGAVMDAIRNEVEAAEYLGISPRTLQRWRVQGFGPKFVKLGKKVGYTDRDLADYVNSSRRQSTGQERPR